MGGRGAGGGGAGGGGGGGVDEATAKEKAKLADLKKKLGAEVMYSPKWLTIQRQYRDLYKKIYGPEKPTI